MNDTDEARRDGTLVALPEDVDVTTQIPRERLRVRRHKADERVEMISAGRLVALHEHGGTPNAPCVVDVELPMPGGVASFYVERAALDGFSRLEIRTGDPIAFYHVTRFRSSWYVARLSQG